MYTSIANSLEFYKPKLLGPVHTMAEELKTQEYFSVKRFIRVSKISRGSAKSVHRDKKFSLSCLVPVNTKLEPDLHYTDNFW